MRQPLQPLALDDQGVLRFRENEIVRFLLDWASERGMDLNELARRKFSQADREQFAQLIGYSLCGFHELSYVSDQTALAASAEAKKLNPEFGGCRDDGCEWHTGVPEEGESPGE